MIAFTKGKNAIVRIAVFLDRWRWIGLAVALPFLWFPTPERVWVLAIVPILWLVAGLAGKPMPRRTPLNVPLLFLFGMVLVSLWATYDLTVSLPKIAGMVLAIAVFFAFVRESETGTGWWFCLAIFLLTGLGIAGVGLLGMQAVNKIGFLGALAVGLPQRIRLPGAETGFHPNEVAGALLWVLPTWFVGLFLFLSLRRLLQNKIGSMRWLILTFMVTGMTCAVGGILVLTQSRGAYLGCALAMLVLVIAYKPRRRMIALGGAGLIGLVILGLVLRGGGNPIVDASSRDALSAADIVETTEGRLEVWSRALYAIEDVPFTGMGMNTFRKVMPVLYPLFSIGPETDIAHAHNEFLQVALDLGVPGLIAFLALYLGAGILIVRLVVQPPSLTFAHTILPPASVRALTLGLGAGLLAQWVFGLTDAITLGAKPGILFWMILGLIVGLNQLPRQLDD